MAEQEIIREFLVSLGFKVDERGMKNFTDGVNKGTLAVTSLVGAIATAAMAVAADVTAFALRVENFYFAAQRSGAAVSSLKALGNAAKDFGIESNEAASSVEALASAMRNNPGHEGFLNFLGVKTRDANNELRDTAKILVDLGVALQKYSPSLRNQYAKQFGLSERMLLAITNPAFEAAYKKQEGIQSLVPLDEAAQKAHDFDVKIRQLRATVEGFGNVFRSDMLDLMGPQMDKAALWFERNQTRIVRAVHGIADAIKFILSEVIDPIWDKLTRIAGLIDKLYDLGIWIGEKSSGKSINPDLQLKPSHSTTWNKDFQMMPSHGVVSPTQDRTEYLDSLDKKYGLPSGWMRRLVSIESGGNQNAVSPKGAQGAAQLMPETQKALGVRNPFDFYENTDGGARYSRDMLIRYSGNLEKAAAAYNWGPGNVDKKGLGAMPAETQKYVSKMTEGFSVNQTNNITVNGSSDPQQAANEVESRQRSINSEMTRNFENRLK